MKALKYSDVSLKPNFSSCKSRSECSTSTSIFGRKYKLPIIPANMKAVVTEDLCKWLSSNGYFYIMHRFDVDNINFVDRANREDWELISISLGVQKKDVDTLYNLKKNSDRGKVDCITIDIAHGHSERMKEMLEHCKNLMPKTKIIAGNVATPNAVSDLYRWGADMVKVGIGQGSPCTTKDKTGFTMPMFTCVKDCAEVYSGDLFNQPADHKKIPIIADGGIKCTGDIAKALVAGADLVMAGGIFAACTDSPSHSIEIDGSTHKAYYGSASFENKKTKTHIEGVLKNVPASGMTYKSKLIEIEEDIKSSISYAGGADLSALNQKNVEYTRI
jgi:GMP reductase